MYVGWSSTPKKEENRTAGKEKLTTIFLKSATDCSDAKFLVWIHFPMINVRMIGAILLIIGIVKAELKVE